MLHPSTSPLVAGDIQLDPATRHVTKAGEEISLSMTEYEILYYMMRRSGEFLPFNEIYTSVWEEPSCGDLRTLFTHVANLRKKIEDVPQKPEHIVTHHRSGYVFS